MTRLRQLRDERGESIANLARILDAPASTVGKWDRGEREMDYATLIKVADYYEVSLDYLLARDRALDSLRSDEISLLKNYRSLSASYKRLLVKISKLMLNE